MLTILLPPGKGYCNVEAFDGIHSLCTGRTAALSKSPWVFLCFSSVVIYDSSKYCHGVAVHPFHSMFGMVISRHCCVPSRGGG